MKSTMNSKGEGKDKERVTESNVTSLAFILKSRRRTLK